MYMEIICQMGIKKIKETGGMSGNIGGRALGDK